MIYLCKLNVYGDIFMTLDPGDNTVLVRDYTPERNSYWYYMPNGIRTILNPTSAVYNLVNGNCQCLKLFKGMY